MQSASNVAQENTSKENLQECKDFKLISKAFLQLAISAFKPKCICNLHNEFVGSNNTTELQML